MAAALLGAEDAARGLVDAVLAGERYVVSHGDLRAAVDERSAGLRQAAVSAVERHPA
jgi:hypothetical protein